MTHRITEVEPKDGLMEVVRQALRGLADFPQEYNDMHEVLARESMQDFPDDLEILHDFGLMDDGSGMGGRFLTLFTSLGLICWHDGKRDWACWNESTERWEEWRRRRLSSDDIEYLNQQNVSAERNPPERIEE